MPATRPADHGDGEPHQLVGRGCPVMMSSTVTPPAGISHLMATTVPTIIRNAGAEGAHVEAGLGVAALLGSHEEEPDDRGDDADHGDDQGQVDGVHAAARRRPLRCRRTRRRRGSSTETMAPT